MPEMTGLRSADAETDDAPRESVPEAIEVTSAMIEAGVYAARGYSLGERLEDLVLKIYLAMALEAQ
jgi:hypothetical protein